MVNSEIVSAVTPMALKNDKFYQHRQHLLGKAASGLARALNITLSQDFDITKKGDLVRLLNESAPHLNPIVMDLSGKTPVTENLFGPNLGERIKAAKALHQATMQVKASESGKAKHTVSPSTLNWRRPTRSRGDQGIRKGLPQKRRQGRQPSQRTRL
ncbi:hypothetical protein ABEB36_015339 [Hypothenemus hampei]|uniref:Uncharacterized protein n=1 Tax=Hypothenemus hampei TaxID=57062 RepID=A0ABD1DZW4_HYPHA